MKRLFLLALLIGSTGCTSEFTGTQYGEALTLSTPTELTALLEAPAEFVGERVQVEGIVQEVCTQRGCWMDIAVDNLSEKIQVKVEDDVIVFPISAKGKKARVEGIVQVFELTEQQVESAAKHRAEDQGETFDPESIEKSASTVYRIQGLGAIIAE